MPTVKSRPRSVESMQETGRNAPQRLVAHSTSSAWAPYTQRQICFFLTARGWQAELAVDGRARPVHATRAVGAVGAGRRCEPYPLGEQRDAIVHSHVLSDVHSVAKLGRGADTWLSGAWRARGPLGTEVRG